MKGMGAAMGYTSVAELSHELETLLDNVRNGGVVTPAIIDALFAGVDALEQAVDLATRPTPQPFEAKEVIARIRAAGEPLNQNPTAEFAIPKTETKDPIRQTPKRPQHVRIDSRRLDTLMNAVGELVIARDRIAQIAERLGDE